MPRPLATFISFASLALLAGCGQRATLEPRQGQNLPVAPVGSTQPKTVDELLEPPTQASPERNVELRRRSEEREDDPFDLPPE